MKSLKLVLIAAGFLLAACSAPTGSDSKGSSSDLSATDDSCGRPGESCCWSLTPCEGTAECDDRGGANSVCVATDGGASGTPDDAGAPAPASPCGQDGQACCANDVCSGNLICEQLGSGFDTGDTVCADPGPTTAPTCGEAGLQCCFDIHPCSTTSTCNDQGFCVAN